MSAEAKSSAMHEEFGTLADWTAEVGMEFGADHRVPASCQGSKDPGVLDWFLDALAVTPSTRLLDVGAGTGGPAAYAARRRGVEPVLVDPEIASCRAARRMFGLPVVTATAQQLPFAADGFDTGWSLAVLCTTHAQRAMLQEQARVVRGRIGLLVYVRTVPELPYQPQGNDFPTGDRLERLLTAAGLRVVEWTASEAVSHRPDSWKERAEAVEDAIMRRHGAHPSWQRAHDQRALLGRLQHEGLVRGVALVAERTPS